MHKATIALWILVSLALLWPYLAQAQAPAVQTLTVQETVFSPAIRTSGTLVNPSEQALAFKTAGIVTTVAVKEGQSVKRGQRLAALDTAEIDAEVEQSRALLLEARRDEQRLRQLHGARVVPLDQLQAAETAVAVATARLKVAEFNQRHSVIDAPQDGVILRRLIEPNELVNGQRTAFIFAEEGRGWRIRVGLSDRDIVRIREGDAAEIVLDAWPGQRFAGVVEEVAAKSAALTGTFEVEIRLPAQPQRLLSGMVGRVVLQPRDTRRVTLIPLTALIAAGGNQAQVFVLDAQQRAHRRAVVIDHFDAEQVAIAEGLSAGETIVTRGATMLTEGQIVATQTFTQQD